MKKVSFVNYFTSIMVSGLMGGLLAIGVLFTVVPTVSKIPPIPVLNYENMKISSSNIVASSSPFGLAKLPNAPVTPVVPDMMQIQSAALEVIGVLPPDVVILQRAGETVTAFIGDDTKFGVVEEIDAKGAVINGKYVSLKLNSISEGEDYEEDE